MKPLSPMATPLEISEEFIDEMNVMRSSHKDEMGDDPAPGNPQSQLETVVAQVLCRTIAEVGVGFEAAVTFPHTCRHKPATAWCR